MVVAGVTLPAGKALAQTVGSGDTRTTGITATGDVTIEKGATLETIGEGGIKSDIAGTTITNDGSITTSGDDAHGIRSEGADAKITVSGSITTSGDGAYGINSAGADAKITISGSVSATGLDSYAVKGSDGGDQTLNLLPGARILGRIDLGTATGGGDTDVVNILGVSAETSRTYAFEGAEKVNIASSTLAFRSGDTVVLLDPTALSATRMALGATTAQIRRAGVQSAPGGGAHSTAAMKGIGSGWATLFGTRSKHDIDDRVFAWDHSFYGVVGGIPMPVSTADQKVGLFAGVGRGKIKTADVTSVKDSATHVFAGVSGQQAMGGMGGELTLDGAVVFGYARHRGTRSVFDNLAGDETARGKYNSFYINPSLALQWSRQLGRGFELRPGAEIAYTYGRYGAYTESGTTNSNIKFDDRDVNIVDGRLQLALARPFANAQGEIELRGGATFSHYGKDSVDASVDGGPKASYRVPGDRTILGGFTGINLRYAINDGVTVGGDIEYAMASGIKTVSGRLGLAVQF